MTKARLQSLKTVTTWGGAAVTLGGIVLGVANGGSRDGAYLSAFGLLLTCCGNVIASRLAKHQSENEKADKQRIADFMQASMDGAYAGLASDEDAKARKIIQDLRSSTDA